MKMPVDTKLKSRRVPIEFEYRGEYYRGEAKPVAISCNPDACWELEVTLNNEELGKIHCTQQGWRMDYSKDEGLVNKIGEVIALWYE